MFRRWRLKKAHRRFLESCRNLKDEGNYWSHGGGIRKWFLQLIAPFPLMGLLEEGAVMLVALEWMESNCRARILDQEVIRHYHMTLFKGSATAGLYRKVKVTVQGSSIPRPSPDKIALLMNQLELRFTDQQRILDRTNPRDAEQVLRAAVDLHQRLAFVHPFEDGNGRVARLAMNHLLRRYDCGYVILPQLGESSDHFKALEEAHRGRMEALTELARKHVFAV